MILVDLHLQVLVCSLCGEPLEIPRALLRDQHALLELQDATRRDHRECAAHPHDPDRAARHRSFRKRMEREMRKAAAKAPARRRCNGK